MYKEIFHKRIKEARITAGYTQKQVSDNTRIKRVTISKYETGKLEPNTETLGILATFYKVPIDWLIGIGPQTTYRQNQ